MSRNFFIRSVWLATLLFVACSLRPALHAQTGERKVPGRYLFIFDTSANMKKRLPAVQKALTSMLATSLGGQLHTGDTIGVWTFNQDLHPGDFPLQVWDSNDAAGIAAHITQFIGGQKYANKTRFEALQPLLNRVVQSSERLTVVIFSDGLTPITGTTFDTGINQLFDQNAAAQKKAREPFVVVLRSQLGKHVGCTVSMPPQQVSLPQFPPLPEPPPAPKPALIPVPPPAAPVAVVPSIVITGKNIENHLVPPVENPAPTNPPPVIAPAPPAVVPTSIPVVAPVVIPSVVPVVPATPPPAVPPVMPTNASVTPPVIPPAPAPEPVVIPPATPSVPTNALALAPAAAPAVPTNVTEVVLTNAPVAAMENPARIDKKPLIIGAVCLAAAGMLTGLIFFYFRRPDRRSLITRSMHDK